MTDTNLQPPIAAGLKSPRILVIRGGAIGDFILTLPTLGALRARWPAARIEILGYPHIAELAHKRYYADAVRSIAYGPMSGFFIPNAILDPDLMTYFGGFDLVISYFFDPDKIFAGNLRRCGVKSLLTGSSKPEEEHAATHFGSPLEAMTLNHDLPLPKIYPTEVDRAAAEEVLGRLTIPPVAIHPGSGSERKNWPVDRWIEFCRWLMEEKKREIVLVVGEADEKAETALRSGLKPYQPLVVKNLALPRLAAVLARCALFVGHDSGITHLAAASGAPTLALFASTSPAIWRPLGEKVRVIFRNADWSVGLPVGPGAMSEIKLSAVQKTAAEMLPA